MTTPDGSLYGVLPVDKPVGPTSHDIVGMARRALRTRRIGHTGTLDPFASGLLMLCIGRATRIAGYLKGGLGAWETSGRRFGHVDAINADDLDARLQSGDAPLLLDVRKQTEFKAKRLRGATHVFLGHLPDRLDRLDTLARDRRVVTFCGSGKRAIVAASLLKQAGFDDVANAFGSMAACEAIGCDTLETADDA